MECEAPQKCVGSTFRQLPPLQHGETLVQSFVTPSNLVQQTPSQPKAEIGATDGATSVSTPLRGLMLTQVPAQRSQLPTVSVPVETMPAASDVTASQTGADWLSPARKWLQVLRQQRQQATAQSEQRTLQMPVLMTDS